jgi:hypothetical protein
MGYISDEIHDQGLDWADANGMRLYICSQEPATYAEATATYTLGNAAVDTGPTQNAATGTGRRVVVPEITAGAVTGTGNASHWALVDDTSALVAAGPLASIVAIVAGGTFNLPAFSIISRDPI